MTQQVTTILCLNGIANGSGFTTQQPTVVFENLPYGTWMTLSSAHSVTGRVIGIAGPSQYQVALFAAESKDQYSGNIAWLAQVDSEGNFQMPVQQAAALYFAVLMTPAFAQSYFAQTFPDGSGVVDAIPSPAAHPGDVILMTDMPAGLNRSLTFPRQTSLPTLPPGQTWINVNGYASVASLTPQNNNQAPDPDHLTPQAQMQLWQMMMSGQTQASMSVVVNAIRPDGSQGNGAFAAGVYVYMNTMYLVAGAGLKSGNTIAPVLVSSPLVQWQMFAPSKVTLNMNLTILPERVMLSIDVMEVDPSLIWTFLKLMYKVEKTLLGLLFAEI